MKKFRKAFRYLFGKLIVLLRLLYNMLKRSIRAIHKKKRYAIPFYFIIGYIVLVTLIIKLSGDSSYEKVIVNKRVNDITAINPIQVAKEIHPQSIEEIVSAVTTTSGPISIGGGRFSMGGQTGYPNSLHIDMRKFNKVLMLDTISKQVIVQPGIIWRDLQNVIDKHNLSIKIMQTYANFTVGGSVSVNCHGRYIGHGPIVSSVLQIKIVTASGEVITASRTQNQDVFAASIGGYGGIGVIVEVMLQLTDNVKVERQSQLVQLDEYNNFFNKTIRSDKGVIFQNGDLYPPHYELINSVSYKETDKDLTDTVRVTPAGEGYWLERQLMSVVSSGDIGKWMRRNWGDPFLYSGEKVIWRNREASYDVQELEPSSRAEKTYVLQEYFIPVNNIRSFVPKMKAVFDKYDVNVINVSLRHAYADKETYLSWAPEEVFAFVVYYQQGTGTEARDNVREWTVAMTDAILSEGGRWYLPYQPHASIVQFQNGYKQADKYFEVKNRLDSAHRFNNKLLDKYNPYLFQSIEKRRDSINGYYRDEAQAFLTVPEWYLVFNPKEYADYLEGRNDPSDFPFYASIDEYWTLYDRSMKLVSMGYADNEEYKTMLDVIGVSITMEYTAKMLYENTVGQVFSWFSNGTMSDDEKMIVQAQRAYSNMIYDRAWYEFEFMPWVKQVWRVSNTAESNWFRKVERKLFFTIEFSFKAAYASLIEWAAKASYEQPVTEIYLLGSTPETFETSGDLTLVAQQGHKKLFSIKRWGAFTKAILDLRESEIDLIEIGGNDEIVVSIIHEENQSFSFPSADLLYKSRIVTRDHSERYVYLVPVKTLLQFVKQARDKGVEVEHVFDY